MALAGVMLGGSFGRFSPSMATFNEERASSHPFGRLDCSAMVETQGSYEKAVQAADCEE